MSKKVADLRARQVLDSRGNPTLEVDCILSDDTLGRASVPSGASTGRFESLELRDGNPKRYLGRGVMKAIENVNTVIRQQLVGMNATDQYRIDRALCDLDGTPNKSNLGANATLGASLSVCRAAAATEGLSIYRYLGGAGTKLLPTPQLNIINGGAHAPNNLDVQEFMVIPAGLPNFREALRAATETYQHLKQLLTAAGKPTTIGDEGGFAPDFADNEEPIKFALEAIEKAGYEPGEQVFLGLDVAASELYEDGRYRLADQRLNAEDLIDLYAQWLDQYPLISIEDGLAEDDWEGWRKLTARLGSRVQLVGDDIFVTHIKRLEQGIQQHVANAILIKPNQVGTVSETLDCIKAATDSGYRTVVSHRSGETGDHFIADLAVAVSSGQIKTGAPCRGERVAKYNRLLRIEEEDRLDYAGLVPLTR